MKWLEECINRFLITFGDTAAHKAFHFYTRNTRNAMKHAHFQVF